MGVMLTWRMLTCETRCMNWEGLPPGEREHVTPASGSVKGITLENVEI